MKFIRYYEVVKYGWKQSKQISEAEPSYGRLRIFIDMLFSYKKYQIWTNQFVKEGFHRLSKIERSEVGQKYLEENRQRDLWYEEWYSLKKFLAKYTSMKYDSSLYLRKKRLKQYTQKYNLGAGAQVGYGVMILFQHYTKGNFVVGQKCSFGYNTDIDITGDLTIGNGVTIMEGVKILTHSHDYFFRKKEVLDDRTFLTPLVIHDNVRIGARSIIMPGVNEIGENAIIKAGAVVTHSVPRNAIVEGNPAQVVVKIPEGIKLFKKF